MSFFKTHDPPTKKKKKKKKKKTKSQSPEVEEENTQPSFLAAVPTGKVKGNLQTHNIRMTSRKTNVIKSPESYLPRPLIPRHHEKKLM